MLFTAKTLSTLEYDKINVRLVDLINVVTSNEMSLGNFLELGHCLRASLCRIRTARAERTA